MFLKILKKDLKRKKTLNLTIFLFVILAAALAATSISEIYSTMQGLSYTSKVSNIADYVVIREDKVSERDEIDDLTRQWAKETDYIDKVEINPMVELSYHNIEFMNLTKTPSEAKKKYYYIGAYPKDFNYVYDTEDQPFTIKDGEIAIPNEIAYITGAKVGDSIRLTVKRGNTYEFTISHIFKDTLFPMGYSYKYRFLLSDGDFEQFKDESILYTTWCSFSLNSELGKQSFVSDFPFSLKEYIDTVTWKSTYDMQMTLCIMLMIVSVFLLIIVFITLRFTIISSVQEDYHEIGMMKAVGVPRLHFKLLYQAKYTAIAVIGSFLGYLISIPCARYLKSSFNTSLILPLGVLEILLPIAICVVIVACIVLFSIFALKKTDRMSVVDAIRNGNTGERFEKSSKLYLMKRRWMGMPYYLAITNVIHGIRRYIFLFITYVLGMTILLIPFHVIHSVLSPDYLRYWGVVKSDFLPYDTTDLFDRYQESLSAGEVYSLEGFYAWATDLMSNEEFPVEMIQCKYSHYDYILDSQFVDVAAYFDMDMREHPYDEGVAPILANEIAVSALLAERYDLHCGSIISLRTYDYNEDRTDEISKIGEFVVTGIYNTMDNSGISIRMGNEYRSESFWNIDVSGIRFVGEHTQKEKDMRIQELIDEFGKNVVCSLDRYMELSMSKYLPLFQTMRLMLLVVIVGLLFLMTYLFQDIILSKEIGEVATLKAMGVRRKRIILWQCIRMMILAVPAVLLGIILSVSFGENLCSIVFREYGITHFDFVIQKSTTYVLCPMLVIVSVLSAVLLSCIRIRRIKFQNINDI